MPGRKRPFHSRPSRENPRAKPPARSERAKSEGADKPLQRVCGLSAVKALFATSPERVERLFFDDDTKEAAGAFCAALARVRKPYRLVPAAELERVAGTVLHGGIVAVARPRPVLPFDPGESQAWARDGKPLLLLDGVGNPHNLGAIARSAAFFGLTRLVISDHPGQAAPSDASYRVAEGGLDQIAVYRATGFTAALRQLSRHYRVLGTAAENGTPLGQLRKANKPYALVLGNEEVGLSKATLAACDAIVTIESGGGIQSLNVSVSAGVLLHALAALGSPQR